METDIDVREWDGITADRRYNIGNVCEACGISGHETYLAGHHYAIKGMGGRVSRDYYDNCIILCRSDPRTGRVGCHELAHLSESKYVHLIYRVLAMFGDDPADCLRRMRDDGELRVERA